MVTSSHEALHRIFQEDTALLLRAAQRVLGVSFPDPVGIDVIGTDTTEIAPVERRVDTVLRLDTGPEPEDGYILAIESQGRKDADKPGAWAYYLSYLHAKYRRPALLAVICGDRATAAWASEPVSIGMPVWPALTVRPMVLGPHNVPMITETEEAARDVPMAVLSALTHRASASADAILTALATALGTLDPNAATIFAEYVEAGLGDAPAGKKWKELMETLTPFFRSEAAKKTRAEGHAEGRAEGHRKDARRPGPRTSSASSSAATSPSPTPTAAASSPAPTSPNSTPGGTAPSTSPTPDTSSTESRPQDTTMDDVLTPFFRSEAAKKTRAEGHAEGHAEGRAEGRAQARAEDVVRILQRRNLPLTDTDRRRILTCTDLTQLDTWWDRAFDITDPRHLFG